ncbi:DUF5908 family protein [Aquimarina sp. 2201CG5-10]|uniref:DUF5908 family protein n=1 Tax=Aquimarina callyspongiae TaxID=3098150 RepID=UPI002AB42C03|nr:DUF5908 family protein [Aquimarina sp. 2201CG5-10]MDY8138096.1 DUF5908 family protein [Aquimarina sp. 2201CG5-10]
MGAIEIKELHIKINVDNNAKKGADNPGSKKASGADKDAIIAECVEQVMDIIAKQTER